jgi:sulfatase maturation enzyme AslB (radical SAM superfamily)
MVIVTMSLDGIGKVHDYARWPIKWTTYERTVKSYKELQTKYKLLHLDFWSTVSALNIADLPNIEKFARDLEIPHDWAFLQKPAVLNVRYKNALTDRAKSLYPDDVAIDANNQEDLYSFIGRQDKLRGIKIKDYFNFL